MLTITITNIFLSKMVIRGTISKKKFKKIIHQYSNKIENTFSSIESTYLCFCLFYWHLSKYSICFLLKWRKTIVKMQVWEGSWCYNKGWMQ